MVRPSNKKILKKRIEQRIKKIFYFYLLPFFILFVIFVYFFNSEKYTLDLNKIEFQNKKLSEEEKRDIRNFLSDELNQYYWNLFLKKNIYFIPKEELLKKISEKFLIYKNFNLENDAKILKIYFEKRKEKFLYLKSNQYFAVDKNGFIFKKIKENKKEKGDDNNKIIFTFKDEKKVGQNIFNSEKEKKDILVFIKRLKDVFGIEVKKIENDNIYYYFIDRKDKEFKIKQGIDLGEIIVFLKKVLREKEVILKDEENLKYIYLNNKMIKLCYKDQECAK